MEQKPIRNGLQPSKKKSNLLSMQAVFGDDYIRQSKAIFPQYKPFKTYVQSALSAAKSKSSIGAEFVIVDRNNDLRMSTYIAVKVLTKTLNGKRIPYDEATYENLSMAGLELEDVPIESITVNGKPASYHMIEDAAVVSAGVNDKIEVNGDSSLAIDTSLFLSRNICYRGKLYEVRKQKVSIPGFEGGTATDALYPFIEYRLEKDDDDTKEGEVTIEIIDDPSFNVSVYDIFFGEGVNQVYFGDVQSQETTFKYAYQNKETGRIVLKLDGRTIDPKQKVHVCANFAQLSRQVNAIDAITNRPNEYQRPLLSLAASKRNGDPLEPFQPRKLSLDYKVLTDARREGTAEQRDFVQKAMQTPDFMILQGPPGSGKTTAILELIYQLCKQGKRVLLCASTHVAIDNVLEKIILHKDAGELLETINPVRVGDEYNVYSESVKPFIYSNQIAGKEQFAEIMNQSFNLVCGTVIGVLQFPQIKAAVEDAKNVSIEPLFDVMILDEASKTTFSEFLVPAVISKRWIIVGDVKQLAPYVEKNDLVPSLLECPPLKDVNARLGLNMLLTLKSGKQERYVNHAFVLPKTAIEYVDRHLDVDLPVVAVTNGAIEKFTWITETDINSHSPLCAALSANTAIFLIDEELVDETLEFLPKKVKLFHYSMNAKTPAFFDRYQILHQRECFDGKYTSEYEDWSRKVEDEILWRMIRLYELSDEQSSSKKYTKRINEYRELISDVAEIPDGKDKEGNPKFISQRDQFDRTIDMLRNIAIPSIIMMLQEGINKGAFFDTILTSGFTDAEKVNRFVRLEYQHRMHPDISRIPRQYVYQGQALNDSAAWTSQMDYPSSVSKRFEVRHVEPSADTNHNRNEHEADAVINELKKFMKYAASTPKKDGKRYQIAILSFYNGPIVMLRKKLQDLFKQKVNYNFHGENIDVALNTVDKFQGQEADVVYLSTVRGGQTKTMGFLDSVNRVNVALTRAKEKVIVFGDKPCFMRLDDTERLKQVFKEGK